MSITYDKFFRITNCDTIIFLEDDFVFENRKESLFYGLTRLNRASLERLYVELKEAGADFADKLREYSAAVSPYTESVDWENEIPGNDIETFFSIIEADPQENRIKKRIENRIEKGKLREIYTDTDIKDMIKFVSIFNQYGLGVQIPGYFEQIFNDYIYRNGEWTKFKIYTNFNAKTRASFVKDLYAYGQSDKTITCIIDNQLEEEQRANEILQEIEKFNGNGRKNIITAILSSKEKEERVNRKVFAEYVSKDVSDGLQIALARSAFSLLLFRLKNIYQKILKEAFNDAIVNRDIAYYFSKMASAEGVTNYKVVTDWISLLFRYRLQNNDEISDIIRLTRMMDLMYDEDIPYSEEMQKLNTFEAFDLSINRYYQPPAAGDIFKDKKGNYYILAGQDCDLMISQSRRGNHAVSEFVKASVVNQTDTEKYAKNLEYMYVNNFRESDAEQPKGLEIKYSSRVFLDNAVIRLCCFNKDGTCRIPLKGQLDLSIQDMIPPYLCDTYEKLQTYLYHIDELRQTAGDGIRAVFESEFSPRLTSILQYEKHPDGSVEYPYRRVARLNRNYMLYLYKLFLEYRGRYPFDCLNLTRHASLTIPVTDSNVELPVEVILSTNREDNRKQCFKKLDWYIDPGNLEQVIKELFHEDIHIKDAKLLVLKESKNIIECAGNKKIILTKTKKGAQLQLG